MKESSWSRSSRSLRRVHGQHAVDGEVPAHVAQELDVVERRQPLGVVEHDGVGAALAEFEEAREHALDGVLVGLDGLDRKDAPRLVLAGGIADARGAAAHQRDRLAARLLQPVQHHDRDQVPHMQGRRSAVVADIGDHLALRRQGIEPREVGALVDEPALVQHVEEIGTMFGHSGLRRLCGLASAVRFGELAEHARGPRPWARRCARWAS